MLRWALIVGGALIAIAAIVYLVGMFLPRNHTARMEGKVARPPADLAATIREVRDYPSWRKGVEVVDVVESPDATTYVEVTGGDRIAYRLTEPERDARFVAVLTDPGLPFGGRWTISLSPDGAGTRVRIQENGEVRNPVFRFMSRFVFGHTASIRTYLESLGATEVAEHD